jgi:hypothetical protein
MGRIYGRIAILRRAGHREGRRTLIERDRARQHRVDAIGTRNVIDGFCAIDVRAFLATTFSAQEALVNPRETTAIWTANGDHWVTHRETRRANCSLAEAKRRIVIPYIKVYELTARKPGGIPRRPLKKESVPN